jgi:hypothetical protein
VSDEPITFLASLPPIMSALRIGQDGCRLQLDIPASEDEAIQELTGLHGKVLSVAIVVAERERLTEVDDATDKETKRSPDRLDRRRA